MLLEARYLARFEIRRVARIWKKGGLFWKSEKTANDLDRNFHCSWVRITRFIRKLRRNFSENSEIQTLFQPKNRWFPKKKVFTEIETDFSAKIGNSNAFSAQKQVISKTKEKKGLHRNWDRFFGQNRNFKRFFRPGHDIYFTTSAPIFFEGELFSLFHQKSASKAPKTCDFAYFAGQWGRLETPSPPPPGYATARNTKYLQNLFIAQSVWNKMAEI